MPAASHAWESRSARMIDASAAAAVVTMPMIVASHEEAAGAIPAAGHGPADAAGALEAAAIRTVEGPDLGVAEGRGPTLGRALVVAAHAVLAQGAMGIRLRHCFLIFI